MNGIKNFERLLMKGVNHGIVVKKDKLKIKRSLIETLLNVDYIINIPGLYTKLTKIDVLEGSYFELKIDEPLEYNRRTSYEDNKSYEEFITKVENMVQVSVYNCIIGKRTTGSGSCEVIRKKCIGKYILTTNGELVVNNSHLGTYPTTEKILSAVIENIVDGYANIKVLDKLPLQKFDEDFKNNGKNMKEFIFKTFSDLSNRQIGRFMNTDERKPLLESKKIELEEIRKVLEKLDKESDIYDSSTQEKVL